MIASLPFNWNYQACAATTASFCPRHEREDREQELPPLERGRFMGMEYRNYRAINHPGRNRFERRRAEAWARRGR